MKKRSKLDLSQGVEQHKSQATGFEPDVPKAAVSPPPNSARQSTKTETERESRSSGAATEPRTSSQARIAKTVAVVALAALSLYLLKRRLL